MPAVKLIFLVLAVLWFSSCGRQPDEGTAAKKQSAVPGNSYAMSFQLSETREGKELVILHPWQQSEKVRYHYELVSDPVLPDEGNMPHSRSQKTRAFRIPVPVRRVIVTSTTHIAYIEALGMTGTIAGLSGSDYVFHPRIRQGIESGRMKEVGYGQHMNFELILSLQPDVIFAYGVTGEVSSMVSRFRDLEIPVVLISEYLENHPLGKAEWIRVFAALFGMETKGDSLFRETRLAYEALTERTAGITERPEVLSGLPWKDTWHVAGGQSYAARLIEDAGGEYLWSSDSSHEALSLDIEAVYHRARNADVWINPGAAGSIDEILSVDGRLGGIAALRKGQVFNNDRRLNVFGGNDYWESGVTNPHLVLLDLISIFHPGLVPGHTNFYYRKI